MKRATTKMPADKRFQYFMWRLKGLRRPWDLMKILSGNFVPIVVYQMGKVGSFSVVHSLINDGRSFVFHSHGAQKSEYALPCFSTSFQVPSLGMRLNHRLINKLVSKNAREMRIVTLVRDPLTRNMSAFFEPRFARKFCDPTKTINELAIDFVAGFDHSFPLEWFENRFEPVTGINVYDQPFFPQQGYQVIQEGNLYVLILRCETDDSVKQAALRDFVGSSSLKLTRSNQRSQMDYADKYKQFREKARFPKAFLDTIYASKFARHFYSAQEIARMYARYAQVN